MRWSADEVLLTNDVGEHVFMAGDEFARLCNGALSTDQALFFDLKGKHFVHDSASALPLDLLATKFRTKRAFLEGFTRLHLFVVTLRCDHSCPYCQVSRVTQDRARFDMSEATSRRAVDLMFGSPSPVLKLEFQGGEPLLNFDRIRSTVHYAKTRNLMEGRHLEFVVATNLALLTDEMLEFCGEHEVCLSTSLDGPAFLHNANRPRPGHDSHEVMARNLERARAVLGHDRVAAIMTTTERSLRHPTEIVDEYVRLGFDAIFLRNISPYGFAVRTGAAHRYETDRFLTFYKTALTHIINLNRRGTAIVEVYAQILLRKMLTPFASGYVDLQSPAGAGIAGVVYNYDGNIYASDEGRMLAEMGDTSFRLGHVGQSYREVFGGPLLRGLVEGSCHETMPGCSECAFAPFCGTDPVFHWATQGDPIGHRPTSAFCAKNMAIIRHLFSVLRGDDAFARRLLLRWAVLTDCGAPAVGNGS
jgi:His-Xaa-Ser system radical SAM maturase HxsB